MISESYASTKLQWTFSMGWRTTELSSVYTLSHMPQRRPSLSHSTLSGSASSRWWWIVQPTLSSNSIQKFISEVRNSNELSTTLKIGPFYTPENQRYISQALRRSQPACLQAIAARKWVVSLGSNTSRVAGKLSATVIALGMGLEMDEGHPHCSWATNIWTSQIENI